MFKKLYFAHIDDTCTKTIFVAEITEDGHTRYTRAMTQEMIDVVGHCFRFFNETRFDAACAIDIDGGIADGIMRCGIRHDIAED